MAEFCLEQGADMINDISAGSMDDNLWATVAKYNAYYCLMHMQNKPKNMQDSPKYEDVSLEVLQFLKQKLYQLDKIGVKKVMVDPGFGFGKRIEDNYQLLRDLSVFNILEKPILAGLSRKSMIYKPLGLTANECLSPTSALHLLALQNGASILRVHDVKEANEIRQLYRLLQN